MVMGLLSAAQGSTTVAEGGCVLDIISLECITFCDSTITKHGKWCTKKLINDYFLEKLRMENRSQKKEAMNSTITDRSVGQCSAVEKQWNLSGWAVGLSLRNDVFTIM
jgi:hypothetical protein